MAQSDTCWKAAGWYKWAQRFHSSTQNASLPSSIHKFDVHPHRSHKTASLENNCPIKNIPFLRKKKKSCFFFPPSPLLIAAQEAALTQKKERGNSDAVLGTLNVLFLFTFFLPLLKINATRKSRSMWWQSSSEASSQRQLLTRGTCLVPCGVRLEETAGAL